MCEISADSEFLKREMDRCRRVLDAHATMGSKLPPKINRCSFFPTHGMTALAALDRQSGKKKLGKFLGRDVVVDPELKSPMTELVLCDLEKAFIVIEDEYGRAHKMLRSDYERVRREHPELELPEVA